MLLHLTPRCFGPVGRYHAELLEYRVKEIGLALVGGVDLATRKPYPHKGYSVGCRVNGTTRADSGLLIETDPRDQFTTTATWQVHVGGRSWEAVHHVAYVLLDNELDAATDDMVLWSGFYGKPWANRWPDIIQGPPCNAQPRFDVYTASAKIGDVFDTPHAAGAAVVGAIARREERFYMPTVERVRIVGTSGGFHGRIPPESLVIAV